MEQQTLFDFETLPVTEQAPCKHPAHRSYDWRTEVACSQPQLLFDENDDDRLFQWTDEEISRMRVGLLITSLHDVCDGRLSAWATEEVWEWIEDDSLWPFSFRACVVEYDPRIDPDELREAVRRLADRLKAGEGDPILDLSDLRSLL